MPPARSSASAMAREGSNHSQARISGSRAATRLEHVLHVVHHRRPSFAEGAQRFEKAEGVQVHGAHFAFEAVRRERAAAGRDSSKLP